MIRKAAWVLFGVALLAALAPSQNFAQRNVAIRAGIVLLDSQQQPLGQQANYTPYVWFNLDLNKAVKPPGWYFYNPVAPTMVTDEIATRWGLINNNFGYGPGPVAGQGITKRDAAYWEVKLSNVSDAQITSFDVLLVTGYGSVQLNPLEQVKLRKFLEAGGVLWVDIRSGGSIDAINGFPLGFTASNVALGGGPSADFVHPLMSNPYTLSFEGLNLMQSEAVLGLRSIDFDALSLPDLKRIQSPTQADSTKLLSVAADNIGPVLAVGQVGDGFMVVTCRGVANTINYSTNDLIVPPGANRGSRAFNPIFGKDAEAAGKLAINIANLTSGHSQMGKGARKSNSTPIDVSAPLLKRFSADVDVAGQPLDYYPPAIFQGLSVMTTGNWVRVFDANPASDLNKDGNPDDGIPDYSLGSNFDLVWEYQVGAESALSAPACAEVPGAPAGLRQQIAVVGESGNLYIFDAFPAGAVAPATVAPPAGTSTTTADASLRGRGPYAPTYHDGLIFVTDEASAGVLGIVSRVWIADAATGAAVSTTARWQAGGTLSPNIQRPSGGAVVGYIPIADNSGGSDRVVYIPTRPLFPSGNNAGITSLWLGAKGEKPANYTVVGSSLIVNTRASVQGLDVVDTGTTPSQLGIRLTILDNLGKPLSATQLNNRIDGTQTTQLGGVITFTFRTGQTLAADESVRVDYTIDWGTNDVNKTALLMRGQIFLPDDTNKNKRILHNMALSPQGTLHLVHSTQGDGGQFFGSFYSLREEGRGAFKLLTRYDLYPSHTFTLNQSSSTTVRETLFDTDELVQVAAQMTAPNDFLGGNFSNLTFMGGPSILNGTVYVTARGMKNAFVPCTILLAFQAEPDIPQIFVNDLSGSFTILQPDIARSSNKTLPDQYNTLQPAQFVYERQPGADRGTVRLDNLMSTTRGQMQNAISRSQPIIIRRSGQPDQLIEPDRVGSRWSPMLWYTVFHGFANQSPPTVTGNTVFLAGNSALPSILRNGSFAPVGVLAGMDADISPTDTFLVANPLRPWLKQLWSLKVVSLPNDIRSNPDIRWPQNAGVNSFQAWAIRLMQTTLGSKTNALGVVAGDGVLLSWAPNSASAPGGLFGFSRADFVVADEGRLGRFDPAGNPIWATDAGLVTGTSADVGSAADVKPLVRPTRAYPIGARDLLVVDTSADRVLRLDAAGREIRSIDRFKLWPDNSGSGSLYTPDGYQTNDPLTLKAPRDVVVYTDYVPAANNRYANAAPLEFWVHYVIADSANKRIVELVDRFVADPATRRNLGPVDNGLPIGNPDRQQALGVLFWHSPSSFSGKNFSYSSLARVYVEDTVTPANSRWVYAAGIGSALPTRVDTGLDSPPARPRESEGGNGGIVIFDGANSQIINEVTVPGSGANVYYNPATGLFDAPARSPRQKILGNLSSVTMRNIVHPTLGNRVAIMFTDADGVFEIVQQAVGGPWTVDWMLTREVYQVIRRNGANVPLPSNVDLRAYYARRLDSGEVLVVNGYYGKTRGSGIVPKVDFSGEVFQVDGDLYDSTINRGFDFNRQNLGFDIFSIRFELPPITGTRGLVIPVFADRR